MKQQTRFVAVLSTLTCLLGTGCALESLDDGSDDLVGSHEADIESENRLSMNRLSMNRLSMNGLSQAALSTNGTTLANNTLIVDEPGRELLTYMARCALKSDQSLTATYDSVTYTFPGQLGLAHDWLTKPLTDLKKQTWVSACLLAHVNGYGVGVPISLRGAHPALLASEAEKAEYSVQEAAFYGNVFEADINAEAQFYSCAGSGLRDQCGAEPEAFRPQRSCVDALSCALAFSGICKDPVIRAGNSCKAATATGYADCLDAQSDNAGKFPSGAIDYKEVITVYLRPAEFNSFYVGCNTIQ
jgi:hypothetical protein